MPIVSTQTLYDTTRKARFRILGRFLTGDVDESNVLKIEPAKLVGALNTAGLILAGNTSPRPFYNTTIKHISWSTSATNAKSVSLLWQTFNGSVYSNTVITHLGGTGSYAASRGPDISFSPYGQNASNIMLSTQGFTANDFYSIEFDIVKSAEQFDWGEWGNPQEFNFRI